MDVAVYTTDLEGRVTLYNDAAVALWGRRPVIGDAWWCRRLETLHRRGCAAAA